MPLDPRLILGGDPPQPFNTPFSRLAQVRAQQQAQQEQSALHGQAFQIGQQRIVQGQRELQAAEAAAAQESDYRRIIGNPDLTPEAIGEQLRVAMPEKYDAYLKRLDEHTNAGTARLQAKRDADAATQKWVGGYMDDIAKAGYDPLTTELALKHMETLDPGFSDQAAQIRQSILDGGGKPAIQAVIDKLRPAQKPAEGFTLGEGQTRFNAAGQPIAQGAAKPEPAANLQTMLAKAIADRDGPEQRRLLNLIGQERAAGRAPEKPADEGLVQIMGEGGSPIWVRKSDAVGKPAAQAARAVTGIERQSLAFYNRAQQAAETVTPLEEKIAGMSLAGQARLQTAPNWLQSDENQSYRQAQRAFTEARLRKESGAAVNDAEYQRDSQTYFAQPGDSKATIAQKQKARETVLSGLAFSAGKAYDEFYGEPRPGSKARPSTGGAGTSGQSDPMGLR